MSLKLGNGKKKKKKPDSVRACECVSLCLHILNMSVLKFFFFFFFNGALFYFSDLARQMRSGQTVSCRNCIKCSICGVQSRCSFPLLSSLTNKTAFF